jgi:hypothetical protein
MTHTAGSSTATLSGTPVNANVGVHSVVVTVMDAAGATDTETISITVVNTDDAPTGTVTITGTATEDQVLTASNDIADDDGVGTITYTWSNGDVGTTTTLDQSDVGNAITVTASYNDVLGNNAESITSTATNAVTNINDVGVVTVNPQGAILEDSELTATVADEDGTTTSTITYQWSESSNGVTFAPITGATTDKFTPLQVHVGQYLELYLTYVDDFGQSESFTVHFTGPVVNVNDAPVGTVTITGDAEEDKVLTASDDLTDEDGMGTVTYTWSTGATGNTITLGQSDVGTAITVTASYTDGFGGSNTATSAATSSVANVDDAPVGLPILIGTLEEDQVLTFDVSGVSDEDGIIGEVGPWDPSQISCGLYRGNMPMPFGGGGDLIHQSSCSGSYTLTQSDVGSTIQLIYAFYDEYGGSYNDAIGMDANYVYAASSVQVVNVNDNPVGDVTISGTTQQGQVLTATNDLTDEDGMGAVTYTWSTGATGDTITLAQSDVGTTITVTASYTDAQGTQESVTSTATAAIDNGNDLPTGSVTIAGTAIEDGVLTVSNNLADADGMGTVTYTWSTGATGDTITLTQSDVDTTITVTASYTDGYGAEESVTSAATTAVVNVNDSPTGSVTIAGTATALGMD